MLEGVLFVGVIALLALRALLKEALLERAHLSEDGDECLASGNVVAVINVVLVTTAVVNLGTMDTVILFLVAATLIDVGQR